MSNDRSSEFLPPWIKYPGYAPGDGFWRQSGEAWLNDVWQPYFDSLTEEDQAEYLRRWNVPENWRKFYFDKEFQNWIDTVDDE